MGHPVGGALVAFEAEPAEFAVAGGNEDRPTVDDGVAVKRQGIGGGDAGALAIVHGAGHADEGDALHPGVDEVVKAGLQCGLVAERSHLRAQAAQSGQFRGDHAPVVQDIEFGFHDDRTVAVLLDHAGDHDVLDLVVDADFGGDAGDFARLVELLVAGSVDVGRDQLNGDRIQGHSAVSRTCLR